MALKIDSLKKLPGLLKSTFLNTLRTLPITIACMTVATLTANALFHLSGNAINVSIIYILAILLHARYTKCYSAGIIASLYSVFWVNYAYTYPYMSLNFSLSGYPLTFVGMTFISCFTSSICIMLSKQSAQIQEKDRMLMQAEKETMRANLLRAMSHDLRTPLTTIIGSSAAYLEQEDEMSPIQDDRGMTSVNKTDESLEEVISEAVQRFHKRFPDVPVKVHVPDSFIMVPMDAMLIEQVINNLLENAHFHSGSEKPIELKARTDNKTLYITIKDYGKGIDPKRLPTLFDGGGVNTNESGDSHKGMGIGLSICKTIINAHGGTIQAANHADGAMFTFTLPDWKEYCS